MKVTKICSENVSTFRFQGCTCINCLDRDAEVVLEIGKHETPLCFECSWDLKDLMDETTFTTFKEAEK